MKIKSEKIATPNYIHKEQIMTPEEIEARSNQLKSYINSSRSHLESLKREIYATLDNAVNNSQVFNTSYKTSLDQPVDYTSFDQPVDYNKEPSYFLEKAYTLQKFNKKGESIKNRFQKYIADGTTFASYCENTPTLSANQKLFNDAGKIIGSINSALSQLNKVEANLAKNEYEIAAGNLSAVPGCIQTVLDTAQHSHMINVIPDQGVVRNILSNLANMINAIGNFISNIGKSKATIYRDKFSQLKDKYQTIDTANEPTDDNSSLHP